MDTNIANFGLRPIELENIKGCYTHIPLIQIKELIYLKPPCSLEPINCYTHIIFTSQTAVSIFFKHHTIAFSTKVISVGKKTTNALQKKGISVYLTAKKEQAEGIVQILESLDLDQANILWPRSKKARSVITDYLKTKTCNFYDIELYDIDPVDRAPNINNNQFDYFLFTSPSVVDAYLYFFKRLPNKEKLLAIGPITKEKIEQEIKKREL